MTSTWDDKKKCSQYLERTSKEIERAAEVFGSRRLGTNISAQVEIEVRDHYFRSIQDEFTTAVRNQNRILHNRCTIYRVPPEIEAVDPEAYKPMAVGLGPYCHELKSRRKLRQLEDYKWKCVDKLLSTACSRRGDSTTVASLMKNCLEEMKNLEQRIRDSYSEQICESSDDLATMMMLDGCFILHLLLKHDREEESRAGQQALGEEDDDWTQVPGRCWIWNLVTYDLLLLENQIPFFVILSLYELLIAESHEPVNLILCSSRLFSSIYPLKTDDLVTISCDQVYHLLHLVYLSVIPHNLPANRAQQERMPPKVLPYWIPSAKELKDAGVKFRKKEEATNFLDITFRGGVLEIPELKIFDYSNTLFRNLIAFEQCYPDTRGHVTANAAFMACLVSTQEDARLLHLKGILINGMTREEHTNRFFSLICSGAHYSSDRNYLGGLIEDVTKYHGKRQHKWRAALERNYCTNPWVIISVIAACVLLLLAVTNTVIAVLNRLKR